MYYTNLSAFYWKGLLKTTVFKISLCTFHLSIISCLLYLCTLSNFKTVVFTNVLIKLALTLVKLMTFVLSFISTNLVISMVWRNNWGSIFYLALFVFFSRFFLNLTGYGKWLLFFLPDVIHEYIFNAWVSVLKGLIGPGRPFL